VTACWRFAVAGARELAVLAVVLCVRCYQYVLSPLIGPSCRFTPTCSAYAIDAVRRYGPLRGSWRALRRIARCHPWSPGGHDPA
jgi:hypothetical protein